MDGLTAAYLVAFFAGLGFAVVSFALGSFGGHGDGGGAHAGGLDAHAGGGHALDAGANSGHALAAHAGGAPALAAPGAAHALPGPHAVIAPGGAGHASAGASFLHACGPLLNVTAIAAVACVGGGVGYLARRMGAGAGVSLLASLPSGLVAGYAVGGLARWLRRESRFLKAEPLGGTLASVIAPVSETRLGEVLYLQGGARRSLPARSAGDQLLAPGTEVVILDIKDGIARVAPAAELLGMDPPVRPEASRRRASLSTEASRRRASLSTEASRRRASLSTAADPSPEAPRLAPHTEEE